MADRHPRMITQAGLVEPVPRRVRAVAGDRTVVDTTTARYLWEHPWYPQFLLAPDAVPRDVVEAEGTTAEVADVGTFELFTLVLGDTRTAGGARRLTDATSLADSTGWWRLDWGAFDDWFEEDERLLAHPRSPYVRVDSLPSSRSVRIEVDGVVVAATDRPVVLVETGLPTRYYIPSDDVDMTHLEAIGLRTSCPYKGTVTDYWDVRVGDTHVKQAAWRYGEPLREAAAVAGHVAFLNEKVEVFVDGEREPRPT